MPAASSPHDAACAHHRYPGGCHHPKEQGTQGWFKGHLLLGVGSSTWEASRTSVERAFGLLSSSSMGRTTPQKTSSLVKERYHFTSSLSSITLSANNWGSPPAGRLFSSTQCWRALAYTTTFSQGISLISQHA